MAAARSRPYGPPLVSLRSISPAAARLARAVLALALGAALLAAPARAADLDDVGDQWLPRSDGATWTYAWSNTAYQPDARRERYTLAGRSGRSFRLSWSEIDPPPGETPSQGTLDLQQTDAGLINTDYSSTPPPSRFPVLCASSTGCGNSLAAALYPLIWGTRSPVLAEPLVKGTRWSSLGGANNDVSSDNRYVGRRRVVVPAFPQGIDAAVVVSNVSQAGALGDPFGTGLRTVWWVRGVGPVRIELRHASGETTVSELEATNLVARPLPSDENLFPLSRGQSAVLRWRNSRYMRRWSVQRFSVSSVVNNSARVDVKQVSGPIRVVGAYALATRLSGTTLLSSSTRAATAVRFPRLAPSAAGGRRRFLTPWDLLVYGFGPVAPPLPWTAGETFRSDTSSRDYGIFGVTGVTRVLGAQRVRTPAGTFRAVAVRSQLRQAGSRFGSGIRTVWLAPGVGLVKLVFRHGDGSVSTVERVGAAR